MDKIFPPEFKPYCRAPEVRAAWISVIEPITPLLCENCGGLGFFVLTIAIGGPFVSPPSIGVVGHYANGKWWLTKCYVADCPVCHNEGRREQKL
jgi:hypothetical protein